LRGSKRVLNLQVFMAEVKKLWLIWESNKLLEISQKMPDYEILSKYILLITSL
jgi:hypothetical protein